MPTGTYPRKKGKDSNAWKGGRHRCKRGYVFVYCSDHPFRNEDNHVLEHRLVMEQWLRKHNPNHPALIEIDGAKYLRKG